MNQERLKTISEIKRLVAEKHVNVTKEKFGAWALQIDEATPHLLTASPSEFHQSIHSSLATLKTSHTALIKSDSETLPLRNALCATLCFQKVRLLDRWVFQDVLEGGPAHIAGIRSGDILSRVNGAEVGPGTSPRFGFGASYRLTIENVVGDECRDVSVDVPNLPAKDRPPMIEPKPISFSVHSSGVPIIKISTFPGAVGLPFVHELDRIISEISHQGSERLIVDLRGNIGGGLASLRLMSYLCPDRRPIGYSLTKRHFQAKTDPKELPRIGKLPESKLSQLGMFVKFRYLHKDRSIVLETEGLGPRPFHGHIVVLINGHTHSAAEMVAAFAKENSLATLVGTTTAGEVMGGATFRVGEDYRLRIPLTTWQTWNGTEIESRGVVPDSCVEFSAERASKGEDPQLHEALRQAGA